MMTRTPNPGVLDRLVDGLHPLRARCSAWAALLFTLALPLQAQIAGSLVSFANGVAAVSGGEVHSILAQSNGSILLGGQFNFVNGQPRRGIARLQANGTVESLANFNPGQGANGPVFCVAVQTDGKILIGGEFSMVDGQSRSRIARLNSTGGLDPGFGVNVAGGIADVRAIVVQDDGQILIAGGFTSVNGQPRNRIARLNPADGSLEDLATFNVGTGANGRVRCVSVQSHDGKILIGGSFTSVNGTNVNRIARLNSNGTVEGPPAFNPGGGADSDVHSIVVQGNRQILIGGSFTTVGLEPRNGIARLNENGTVEAIGTFNPGSGVTEIFEGQVFGGQVNSMAVQTDGRIVLGGRFDTVGGQPCGGIARLSSTGVVETPLAFDPGPGAGGSFGSPSVNCVAIQTNGKILLGGNFASMSGQLRRLIARLNDDGSFDGEASFNPGVVANNFGAGRVDASAVQPDGKVVIGGNFQLVQGVPRGSIARLHADGSVEDTITFNAGLGTSVDAPVFAVAVQGDGKILLGGQFTGVDGQPRNYLARLHPNGNVESDETFHPAIALPGQVNCLALQADGKILIGGSFTSVEGAPRKGIARLREDGSLDPTFNPGAGASGLFGGDVYSIAVQADKKIVVGGNFNHLDGAPRNGLARLNENGGLDLAFNPQGDVIPSEGFVNCVALQADGQILVGGSFSIGSGPAQLNLARLNAADGSLENPLTFHPGAGPNVDVLSLALQSDAKILLGGAFGSVNGFASQGIARLGANGLVETNGTFLPGSVLDYGVGSLMLQSDGKIVIGGEITSVEGLAISGLARLRNDPATQVLTVPGLDRIQWLRGGSAPEVEQVTFELITGDEEDWQLVGAGTRIPGGWERTALTLPASGWVRARGRTVSGQNNGSSGLVESVAAIASPPVRLELGKSGSTLNLSWTGEAVLEAAEFVTGPWLPVPNAVSPYQAGPTNQQHYFRLRLP